MHRSTNTHATETATAPTSGISGRKRLSAITRNARRRVRYAGPSLPHGRLKEHAVFNGTFEDVKAYLADVLEDYPQAERLIVPVERLSAFAAKVKTPGNIAHKYYNDIVSTMRGNKEV